jgi:hypothetical protein
MSGALPLFGSTAHVDDEDGLTAIFSPLESLIGKPSNLARWRTMRIANRSLPSFVLIGPRESGVPMRLAIVGGLRPGDTLGGAAVAKLLVELDLAPLLAQDFAVFGYPVANPLRGDGTEPDFELDFWRGVDDPVIHFFERELAGNQLDGVIAVYANEAISGFQAEVCSRVIATEVLWPAIEFIERLVPLAAEPIRYFAQLSQPKGALHDLRHLCPRPFSLVIHTPRQVSFEKQVSAIAFSIKQILNRYRSLIRHASAL